MSVLFIVAALLILMSVIHRTRSKLGTKAALASIFTFLCFEEFFVSGLSRQSGAAWTDIGYSFGHQIYSSYRSQAVVLLLVVILAVLISLERKTKVKIETTATVCVVMAFLALVISQVGINAAGFQLKSYVLASAFFVLGRQIKDSEHSSAEWFWWIASGLSGVTLCRSASVYVMGHSPSVVPFYDGLTTYALLICVVVILGAKQFNQHRIQSLIIFLACAATVGLGMRRTVIAVGIGILIAYPMFSRSTNKLGQIMLRFALTGLIVYPLWPRIEAAHRVLITGSGEDSAVGHLSDIAAAEYYCGLSNIFQQTSGQVTGAVSERSSVLYLHNEYFQQCVLGGKFYLLFSVTATILVLLFGIRLLLTTDARELFSMYCAAALLGMPVIMWFFPYFSTTYRWPCFIGLAIGVVTKQLQINSQRSQLATIPNTLKERV